MLASASTKTRRCDRTLRHGSVEVSLDRRERGGSDLSLPVTDDHVSAAAADFIARASAPDGVLRRLIVDHHGPRERGNRAGRNTRRARCSRGRALQGGTENEKTKWFS